MPTSCTRSPATHSALPQVRPEPRRVLPHRQTGRKRASQASYASSSPMPPGPGTETTGRIRPPGNASHSRGLSAAGPPGTPPITPIFPPMPVPCGQATVTAVAVTLAEITDRHREAVLALRVAPGQERFVGSVRSALAEAAGHPHARPWYRAVCAGGEPVGFVMVSWDVEPRLRLGGRPAGRGTRASRGRHGAADQLRTRGRRAGWILRAARVRACRPARRERRVHRPPRAALDW
jgi:hypothetical protein